MSSIEQHLLNAANSHNPAQQKNEIKMILSEIKDMLKEVRKTSAYQQSFVMDQTLDLRSTQMDGDSVSVKPVVRTLAIQTTEQEGDKKKHKHTHRHHKSKKHHRSQSADSESGNDKKKKKKEKKTDRKVEDKSKSPTPQRKSNPRKKSSNAPVKADALPNQVPKKRSKDENLTGDDSKSRENSSNSKGNANQKKASTNNTKAANEAVGERKSIVP